MMDDTQKPAATRCNQWLLVRSQQSENCYGRFALELLRSEGLNGFELVNLDVDGMPNLGPGDLAVLTRCFLREKEVDVLLQSVQGGARLVGFHPPARLLRRFGLRLRNEVLHPSRVRVRPGYRGEGIPIPVHVPILLCQADGPSVRWEPLADAMTVDSHESGYPAVIRQPAGAGEVAFFLYDLPKAVARIRFGDPDLASLAASGMWDWPHAADLFRGSDDDRLLHLPIADLQTQLVAQLLTAICPYPLARFWYYQEDSCRTSAVFTSDDDWSQPEQFRELSDALVKHGGRATFYLVKDTRLDEEEVAALRRLGHTFAPHVTLPGPDEMCFDFPAQLAEQTELLRRRFGESSVSLQAHCAPWYGYMAYVHQYREQGFRMLLHYLSIPVSRWGGYLCGSGRPLRFADQDGTVYDSWQQPSYIYDDGSVKARMIDDLAGMLSEFEEVLGGCLNDHHTVLSLASHPVSFSTYSRPFFEACLDRLSQEGIPVQNADEWCAFIDRRQAARIHQYVGAGGRLECKVSNLVGRLPLMLPRAGNQREEFHALVDGVPTPGVWHQRLGEDYLFLQLEGRSGREIEVELCPADATHTGK